MKKRTLGLKAVFAVFTVMVVCHSSLLHAQYFEGEVKYELSLLSKIDSLDSDDLVDKLGKIQTHYYKGSNFHVKYPSGDFKEFTIDSEQQKAYLLTSRNELQIANLSKRSFSYDLVKITPVTSKSRNGETLQRADLEDDYGNKIRVFFDPNIQIDPELAGALVLDLSSYYQKVQAVPLIIERETDQFIITMEVREIKSKAVNGNRFTKPNGNFQEIIID